MIADAADDPASVFINCPFDRDYAPIFDAIVFAVMACGFRARTAREIDDGGQVRLDKIFGLIEQSRYGIHDLSRTELDAVTKLPRFNMPFELGLFLAARRFGGEAHRLKRTMVLDIEAYRYRMFISDLGGIDPVPHQGEPRIAVAAVRDWLANVSRRKLAGPVAIVAAYDGFSAARPAICARLGFAPDQIPYFDFVEMIAVGWCGGAEPFVKNNGFHIPNQDCVAPQHRAAQGQWHDIASRSRCAWARHPGGGRSRRPRIADSEGGARAAIGRCRRS